MTWEAVHHAAKSRNRSIRAVIISKNVLICMGIKYILEASCFEATRAVPDVETIANDYSDVKHNLFIIDGNNPADRVIDGVTYLRENYPKARIVMIADSYDLGFVQLGRRAGVNGFCLSGSNREVLITSLELVMLGADVLPAALTVSLLSGTDAHAVPKPLDGHVNAEERSEDPRAKNLSARESEVLSHLVEGQANKVIARKLDVTEGTIKVHIKTILKKIGVANRTQAAIWASTHLPSKHGSSLAV